MKSLIGETWPAAIKSIEAAAEIIIVTRSAAIGGNLFSNSPAAWKPRA